MITFHIMLNQFDDQLFYLVDNCMFVFSNFYPLYLFGISFSLFILTRSFCIRFRINVVLGSMLLSFGFDLDFCLIGSLRLNLLECEQHGMRFRSCLLIDLQGHLLSYIRNECPSSLLKNQMAQKALQPWRLLKNVVSLCFLFMALL